MYFMCLTLLVWSEAFAQAPNVQHAYNVCSVLCNRLKTVHASQLAILHPLTQLRSGIYWVPHTHDYIYIDDCDPKM